MDSVERDFVEALQRLANKCGVHIEFPKDDLVVLKSVSSSHLFDDGGFGQTLMLETVFFPRLAWNRPTRPGAYSDQARRDYDYDSTAEEIVDLPGPRKELPSG